MKTILVLAWAASAGAVYWAPWLGSAEAGPAAGRAAAAAQLPAAGAGEPATWMLMLVGVAVIAFVAARRH